MHFSSLCILAVISQISLHALALPASTAGDAWPQEILDTCTQSVNCKVVNGRPVMDTSPHVKRMLIERAGASGIGPNSTTIVSNKGTIDTSVCIPSDMVNQALTEHCTKQGCTTDAKTFQCPHPSSDVPSTDKVTCSVVQDGNYPLDDQGFYPKMFTAALKQAAHAFTKPKENTVDVPILRRDGSGLYNFPLKRLAGPPIVSFHKVQFNSSIVPSSISAATSQEITINGQSTKVMVGSVRFTITCQDPAKPTCGDILGAAGAAASLLSLFEPAAIGTLISAALGIVSPLCGSA